MAESRPVQSRFGNNQNTFHRTSAFLRELPVVADEDSVTHWLHELKDGDGTHITQLWDRYFQRLIRLAGSKLPNHCRRAFDEEDVALSAFQTFCDRASRGQFPLLSDRDDLWRLLATLTVRKAAMAMRHQSRKKRGAGRVAGESAFLPHNRRAAEAPSLTEILSNEPTPEDAARFSDDLDHLLSKLTDPILVDIALRRLKGDSSEEISAALGTSARTVDRKLRLIQVIWKETAP
jgi:DNA-directed RNA polymerase specialized sigma24 family protein